MKCSNVSTIRLRGSPNRSEEHTSELQSQSNLVCRLLLEKKKRIYVDKYVNNKSDMDRPAKGLGANEWKHSLHNSRSLLPNDLFRITVCRDFVMKMSNMTH